MPRTPTFHHRRGFTLIEMSVVIVLTAVVLGMAVTMLTSLLGVHHRATERASARSEIDRLTDTLRHDLRLTNTTTQPDQSTMVLQMFTGPPVRYALDGSNCLRSCESTADTMAQRERFAIGPIDSWQLEAPHEAGEDSSPTTTVTINLAPRNEHESPPPPIRIVAARSVR